MSHEILMLDKQSRQGMSVMSDAEAEKFLISNKPLRSITGMMMSPELEERAKTGLTAIGQSYINRIKRYE